jgi:hypothetical protein
MIIVAAIRTAVIAVIMAIAAIIDNHSSKQKGLIK